MDETKSLQRIDTPDDGEVQYHEYSPRVIGGLILAYVLAWAPFVAGINLLEDVGALLIIGVLVTTLVLDGRGVLSLRGRIGGGRPPGCLAIGLAIVFFPFLFFWLIPYLAIAAQDTRAAQSRRALERQQRIAELEARLGLLPESAGTCPACEKPLQSGAAYCAYCGEPVTTPLRLCPACGTRTFPDASWCPSCGHPLPPIEAG